MFFQNRKADLTWIKNSALFQSCKSSFIHQRAVKASHFWHSIGQGSVTKCSGMHWAAIQLVVVYDFSVRSIAGSAGGVGRPFHFISYWVTVFFLRPHLQQESPLNAWVRKQNVKSLPNLSSL